MRSGYVTDDPRATDLGPANRNDTAQFGDGGTNAIHDATSVAVATTILNCILLVFFLLPC
jgi:hypothetical protein